MGLIDNLKKAASGVADIVSAPIGLLWDTTRAITSSEYNPGFFGVFSPRTEQLFTGLGELGEGLGFGALGRFVGEGPAGNAVRDFMREAELIYNTEFQIQQGQSPWGLRSLPEPFRPEPGTASIQRVGATAFGAVGEALSSNQVNLFRQWDKAGSRTPGQAAVEELVQFHQRTPFEQDQIKASAWYNIFSGTIDAVGRWYTDPGVMAGKGIKTLRNRYYTFDPVKRLATAKMDWEKGFGKKVADEMEPVAGVRMGRLDTEAEGTAYVVLRTNTVGAMREEGTLKIPRGADEAADEVIELLGPEMANQYVNSMEVHAGLLGGRVDPSATEVRYAGQTQRPVYMFGEGGFDEANRYAARLYDADRSDMPVILEIDTRGLPVVLESIKDSTGVQPNGFFTLADKIPEGNIRKVHRPGTTELDPSFRIGSEKTMLTSEVEKLAHPTQRPEDMAVKAVHRERVQELKSSITDEGIREPLEIKVFSPGSEEAKLFPQGVLWEGHHRLSAAKEAGLTEIPVRYIDEAGNPVEFRSRPWDDVPSRLDENLYRPDGSPIEPDQVIMFDEFADDLNTALAIGAEAPTMAEKFVKNRHMERQRANLPEGADLYNEAMNHRTVQHALNWIDGKSADEIRRVLFPKNVFGQPLAIMLSRADNYADRRTILMAAMGYKLPEFQTLEPLARAKLDTLHREMLRIQRGQPPSETIRAMMGERGRFDDFSPTNMEQIVTEMIGEFEDQASLGRFLDRVSDAGPIDELRMPVIRRASGVIRRTHFYQENPLARPIRVFVENKPHQWFNVKDPQSDFQLRRQLEEAKPLGVTGEDVKTYTEAYMSAPNEAAKLRVVEEMEEFIITKAADKAGMDVDKLQDLIKASRNGRIKAKEYLTSRRYASGDRDKAMWYDPDTGDLNIQVLPILSTQIESWLPLQNISELKRAASRYRRMVSTGLPIRSALEFFNQVWKPTVLLRGGWPIRVVSDEQLRILALTGSFVKHVSAIESGGVVSPVGIFKKDLSAGQRTAEVAAVATGTRPLTSLGTVGARVLGKAAEKMGLIDSRWKKYANEVGVEELASARASFGGPNESTLHSLQALIGRDEFTFLDHLLDKGTGQWRSILATEPEFSASWARVLADQYGRDPFAKHIVEQLMPFVRDGNWLDDAALNRVVSSSKRYLIETSEGRAIADRMPWVSSQPDKWIHTIIDELEDYTAGFNEELMQGILNQKVTRKMLEDIDERLRPDVVHGEIISQTLGTSEVTAYISDTISTAYDLLGRLPTDTLSRQPLFRHLYANEMVRLEDLRKVQGLDLTEDALKRMSDQARQKSIQVVRQYLYDLAETSRFGHMARFMMPFYPAWQEVLKVWGTLAIEDPSVIARAMLIWQAPNKADIVYTDDEGEEFMQFRLSEQMADKLNLTGWQKYIATGGIRLGKSSFNLVLNSPLPSVGPLIQIPANEVVKKKPELEESLRWLLPFGVATNSMQILTSPLVKQLKTELGGPSADDAYKRAFADALTWMDVNYRAGFGPPPDLDTAHDVASKLNVIRLISRLASPAQPIFDSPMKPYIDTYRDLIEQLGPEAADEAFLNEFGQEFFAVTMSRTVSKTGIPPTVEAQVTRRQYEDMIKKYPEYSRLLLGDEALGEFSSAAFSAQLTQPIDPDNPFSEPERTYRPVEIDPRTGTIIEVDRRLGWQEYIQAMDKIDLYRRQMGLPNLRVKEAEPLRAAKEAISQYLQTKYPSWWEDFNTRDGLKWDKRIEALREISKADALINRPDIDGLVEYLEVREVILQELNRRKTLGGPSTLDALSNQDLATVWESAIARIMDGNIAFGPLYYRYLEGDPVRLSSGS